MEIWGKYNGIDKWHIFKNADKYDRGLIESLCGQVVCYPYQLDDEKDYEPESHLCMHCQIMVDKR
jgi:hypothetical protein